MNEEAEELNELEFEQPLEEEIENIEVSSTKRRDIHRARRSRDRLTL